MPISPFGYPLDLTGTALSNKIVGDVTTFTSPESRSFVPAAGPFYVFNMILRNNVTGQLLAPKTDYMVEYLLPEPSMASGKEVAGLIRVINIDINSVSMDYQVIGGTHGNTVTMLQQYLADNPIAPINPVWGEIPDMQVQYPPAAHLTDMKTVFGLGPLVNVIEGVRKALLAGDQAAWGALYNYLNLRLNQEHFSIVNDVTALQRPVPAGPTAGQVLMSQSPTPETYGWGDYVPIPPGSAKVLISTGTARGDWVWGDPSAASLPTPPASGQVLRSTGNMPGDWDWSPSGIEPRSNAFMYMSTLIDLKLWVRKPGLKIEGVMRFGDAALNIASLGLGTTWLVYAFWTGTVIQLEVSTTDYATSPTDPDVFIKIGDPTRTLVGMIFKNDDSMWHTRSVYVDNRQYTALLTDPYTHPEWIKPYEGKKLPADYPYWTGTSSEWSDPTSVSNVTGMEIPVLMFANEIVRVRYNANMNYSTIGAGSPARGAFDIVSQMTTPTIARSSSSEVLGARHLLYYPYGASEDAVYYTEASGVIELYGSNLTRVVYVTMRAAKSPDPDAAGNMDVWNSILAFYAKSTYAWSWNALGFKRENGVYGIPLISSKEHTYLAIEHDTESFNLRAFANHL